MGFRPLKLSVCFVCVLWRESGVIVSRRTGPGRRVNSGKRMGDPFKGGKGDTRDP